VYIFWRQTNRWKAAVRKAIASGYKKLGEERCRGGGADYTILCRHARSPTAITTIPVRQRVDFKIVVLVFQCLTGHATAYLADDCQLAAQPTRRSALSVARRPTTTSNGDRCFASAGPRLWNTLPLNLRLCDSLGQFKRSLKTFLLGCETTAPCDTSFKARRIEKR